MKFRSTLLVNSLVCVSALACGSEDSPRGKGPTNAGSEAGAKPLTDAGAKPQTDAGGKPQTDAGGKPQTDAGGKPQTDAGGKPQTDAGGKPETDAGGKPETDAGSGKERLFKLTIENISGDSALPTSISPGVALLSTESEPLFTPNEWDREEGLVSLAADGSPSALRDSLEGAGVDVTTFSSPVGATESGPSAPGSRYEVLFTATPEDGNLNFATMLLESNDIFIGSGPDGIPLFDADGSPLPERNISTQASLWDVGSEVNEAPGHGRHQGARQTEAESGAFEGVVTPFSTSTHQLPLATSLLDVSVSFDEQFSWYIVGFYRPGELGEPPPGPFKTGLSDVFGMLHNDSASMFESGAPASAGVEQLAEDGLGAQLVAEMDHESNPNVLDAYSLDADFFSVEVTPEFPYFSFGISLTDTNDNFIALGPKGIRMLDESGGFRPADEIEDEIRRRLSIWDAGTEENEIPGAGPNQQARQSEPNAGVLTAENVRRASDPTNAWEAIEDLVSLTIVSDKNNVGTFDVVLRPLGEGIVAPVGPRERPALSFPGLTPVLHVVHSADVLIPPLFESETEAPFPLKRLAEDGSTAEMIDWLEGFGSLFGGIGSVGTAAALDKTRPGILYFPDSAFPGDGEYRFSVTPDAAHPSLSIATMVVPSNDTFLSFGPKGLRLLDTDGTPRSDEAIAMAIATEFKAWDAGTEQNEAWLGDFQAPFQGGPNTGPSEGGGTVRLLSTSDDVWSYPRTEDIVRITISPMD